MSNGHAPGIEFNAKGVTILADGVAFSCNEEDVQNLTAYFAGYSGKPVHVAATVAGDAGSSGDPVEAPVPES